MPAARKVGPGCPSEPSLVPVSQRFPRRVRLTEAADFQYVFKHTRHRFTNRWLCVLATDNRQGHARLGLAISRRVARRAVARNRIKRLVRESFRHWQHRIGALDIVVLGRNDIALQPGRTLDAALEKLWLRLVDTCAGSSSN